MKILCNLKRHGKIHFHEHVSIGRYHLWHRTCPQRTFPVTEVIEMNGSVIDDLR